jgi:Transposase DDE domain
MPSYPDQSRAPSGRAASFAFFARSFAQRPGCPFSDCLSEERLQKLVEKHHLGFGDIFTPVVTLWALLSQCLSASKSCVSAVARVMVLRISLDLEPCSENTGAFCKARAKLPVPFIQEAAYLVADLAEEDAPLVWLWKALHVYFADGTTLSGPDTGPNQAAYPQSSNQKEGLGFPLIRLLVLLSLATGMVKGAGYAPFKGKGTGETSLLKPLLDRLKSNSVLVADSYFCVWWLLAELRRRGLHGAFRLHQTRQADFSQGKVNGPNDHVVRWPKPAELPRSMSQEEFDALPASIEVREVLVRVDCPGFRPKELVVATTLLDAKTYTAKDIAELYFKRWNVELDIRSIKQTLKMEILRGKTPEMMRREIWGHLLAYNLIREKMAEAALAAGLLPRQLSLGHALALYNEFRPLLLFASGAVWGVAVKTLLGAMAKFVVGDRSGRREPRKVKRRPKDCKLLTEPRQQARIRLLAGEQED